MPFTTRLLTFNGGNFKTRRPDLASSYQVARRRPEVRLPPQPEGQVLRRDARDFGRRGLVARPGMINLKGNPAFLLAGETVTADGPETVVMTSSTPEPRLALHPAQPGLPAS